MRKLENALDRPCDMMNESKSATDWCLYVDPARCVTIVPLLRPCWVIVMVRVRLVRGQWWQTVGVSMTPSDDGKTPDEDVSGRSRVCLLRLDVT